MLELARMGRVPSVMTDTEAAFFILVGLASVAYAIMGKQFYAAKGSGTVAGRFPHGRAAFYFLLWALHSSSWE